MEEEGDNQDRQGEVGIQKWRRRGQHKSRGGKDRVLERLGFNAEQG